MNFHFGLKNEMIHLAKLPIKFGIEHDINEKWCFNVYFTVPFPFGGIWKTCSYVNELVLNLNIHWKIPGSILSNFTLLQPV